MYGDGNRLPRSASVLAYGTEDNHLELRARIIRELVENEDKYLDDEYMSTGVTQDMSARSVVKQFAMFSEKYAGEKLTNINLANIPRLSS